MIRPKTITLTTLKKVIKLYPAWELPLDSLCDLRGENRFMLVWRSTDASTYVMTFCDDWYIISRVLELQDVDRFKLVAIYNTLGNMIYED